MFILYGAKENRIAPIHAHRGDVDTHKRKRYMDANDAMMVRAVTHRNAIKSDGYILKNMSPI